VFRYSIRSSEATTMRLLLISLCCFPLLASSISGSAAAADAVAAAAKIVKSMELRICANKVKHAKFIAAAQARQERETAANAVWTDEEFESVEATKPVARWTTVAAKGKHKEFEYESYVTRKRPATATSPAATQVLVVYTDDDVTSDDIAIARAGKDFKGDPAVFFTLTAAGAQRFEKLTEKHLPANDEYFQIGIILDERIFSAPRIYTVIKDQGQITGNFTHDETEALAEVLNSKRILPAKK